jgi:hypothetical protein
LTVKLRLYRLMISVASLASLAVAAGAPRKFG